MMFKYGPESNRPGRQSRLQRHNSRQHEPIWPASRSGLVIPLVAGEGGAVLNGHPEKRLPNTLSVAFPGLGAEPLLAAVGDRVAASAGSACHSGGVAVSPVLDAMGVPPDRALGTVRFSTGALTTAEDIDDAGAATAGAVRDGKGRGDGARRRTDG